MIEVLDRRQQVIRTGIIKLADPKISIPSAAEQSADARHSALKDILAVSLLGGAAGVGARALTGSSYLFGRPSESSPRSLVPTQVAVPIPYYATNKEKELAEEREARLLAQATKQAETHERSLVPLPSTDFKIEPMDKVDVPVRPASRSTLPRLIPPIRPTPFPPLPPEPELLTIPPREVTTVQPSQSGAPVLNNTDSSVPDATLTATGDILSRGLGAGAGLLGQAQRYLQTRAGGDVVNLAGQLKPAPQQSWWNRYKKPLGIAAGVGLLGGGLLGYASRRRKKKQLDDDVKEAAVENAQPNLFERALRGTNAVTEQHIPWYLPGMVGGGLLGTAGGYFAADKIIDKKRKADLQAEVDAAKEEYQQALLANYQPGQIPVQKHAAAHGVGVQLDRLADMLGITVDTPLEKVANLEQLLGRGLGLYGAVALPTAMLAGLASYGYTRERSSDKLLEEALKQRERDRVSRRPPEIVVVPEPVHYQRGITVPATGEEENSR